MNDQERAEVERLASDSVSGASTLVQAAATLLLSTARRGGDVRGVAAACVAAQPSMAGMLTLEAVVSRSATPADAIERFAWQVARAPAAIAGYAVPLLLLGAPLDRAGRPALTVVTCSASAAVEATLLALARVAAVRVRCAEGRPRLEGAGLARALAAANLDVAMFTDAGISAAVPEADAVLVGADAVGDEQFVNKVGTAALCALAADSRVPVYVLAGREKKLAPDQFARIVLKNGPPGEICLTGTDDLAAAGVALRNPYFERVPMSCVTYLVSDSIAMSIDS